MAETALNFGPDWIRALAHGSSTSTSQPPPSNATTIPKYSLAQFRYGREEMLALIPKDPKKPDSLLKDTSKIVKDTFSLPLALIPHTEDEQRLWARSINSDAVLRASGKSVPGNNMGRNRGGSVDRGRGRGRGGYYQRGITYEDNEDGPPSNFSRPKPIERSQSANEKDQRWDDKDRRFDRSYPAMLPVGQETQQDVQENRIVCVDLTHDVSKMADPLSLLREYNINKRPVIERNNLIIFGECSWHKTVKTNYVISGKKGTPEEYYTLECLLYFLKNLHLIHPVYCQQARDDNVPAVRRPDRKALSAYLNGETNTSANIDESFPIEIPETVKGQ